MDLQSFTAFTQDAARREQAEQASGMPASLHDLRERFVGRAVCDSHGARLGHVEDCLITQRGKTPRYLVIAAERRFWTLRPETFVYPLRAMAAQEGEALQTTHTASAIRRTLDFKPEFAKEEAPELISLVDYLAASSQPPVQKLGRKPGQPQ